LRPILYRSPFKIVKNHRIGGFGIKIHPSKYANIYHWLLGDEAAAIFGDWSRLPSPILPYYTPPTPLHHLANVDFI
ncbi:MAG: hypothetical protein KGI56_06295, partial [Acidobacteriota bacterium]|nr:hypothetical protein [Acidobacteriota bacterium]